MTISILPPPHGRYSIAAPASEPESEYEADNDGDFISIGRISKNPKISIVTPGEIVTSDPQWMRGHGTYLSEKPANSNNVGEDQDMDDPNSGASAIPTAIVATVAGTVQKVNKLLSVRPLRSRYTPEIGDLVVGRITEVQSKRWKVDINSTQTAHLLLSSINLPGGILRKRTSTDELQIRSFFCEGELLVAEVQSLFQDGAASLHTRSLKYGKLRNGYFLKVDAKGILRSKSHVLTIASANGGGEVDVILGVNGYVWIAKKVQLQGGGGEGVTVARLEEEASEAIYSSVNESIAPVTRREIARIGNCVRAMVRWNVRVDEEVLNAVYAAALEVALEMGGEADETLEGETGRKVVERGIWSLSRG